MQGSNPTLRTGEEVYERACLSPARLPRFPEWMDSSRPYGSIAVMAAMPS